MKFPETFFYVQRFSFADIYLMFNSTGQPLFSLWAASGQPLESPEQPSGLGSVQQPLESSEKPPVSLWAAPG